MGYYAPNFLILSIKLLISIEIKKVKKLIKALLILYNNILRYKIK